MARKKPEGIPDRENLTFAEAMEFLRVSHQTLYNFVEEGLPSYKIGGKRIFTKSDLNKWVESHQEIQQIKGEYANFKDVARAVQISLNELSKLPSLPFKDDENRLILN